MAQERGKHANHTAFIKAAESEMVDGHLWMTWTMCIIILAMFLSRTTAADKMRGNECGRRCCMPCTGHNNAVWWFRMLSVWIYVGIGSISLIVFERPSELAANYDLMQEVGQWASLEAKVKALQTAGVLTDADTSRLLAAKPTPADQTNNWNASEWRSTRPGSRRAYIFVVLFSRLIISLSSFWPHHFRARRRLVLRHHNHQHHWIRLIFACHRQC